MKLKQIVVTSQEVAELFNPDPTWGIISIRGPGEWVKLRDGWGAILPLDFDDIEKHTPGYTTFKDEQAAQIIDWIQDQIYRGGIDTLIVHCVQGISRSKAVAMFIQESFASHLSEIPYTKRRNNLVYEMLCYHLREREKKA